MSHRRARHLNPSHAGASLVLDSRYITGLSDGDAISTWSDRSGNANDATSTGTVRPTYKAAIQGGQPVVRFDGVDDYLLTADSLSQPCWILSVWHPSAVDVYQSLLDGRSATERLFIASYISAFFSGKAVAYAGAELPGYAKSTTMAIATWQFNTTASVIRKDGGQAATGNVGTQNATSGLTVGCRYSLTFPLDGDVGLMITVPGSMALPLTRRLEQAAAFSFKIPCS
jgi:hypothetical protein